MFTVMTSSPPLPAMTILVNNLNEDHDLYTFIRKVHWNYEIMVCIFFILKVCISHVTLVENLETLLWLEYLSRVISV
jgi:Chromosome segregation protein Spc25